MSAGQIRQRLGTVVSGVLLAVLTAALLLVVGSRIMERPAQEESPTESPEVTVTGPTWTTIIDAEGSPVPTPDENESEQ